MRKCLFKLVFDSGKIVLIPAATRTKAIEQYCIDCGASAEWVRRHCKIENLGIVVSINA